MANTIGTKINENSGICNAMMSTRTAPNRVASESMSDIPDMREDTGAGVNANYTEALDEASVMLTADAVISVLIRVYQVVGIILAVIGIVAVCIVFLLPFIINIMNSYMEAWGSIYSGT